MHYISDGFAISQKSFLVSEIIRLTKRKIRVKFQLKFEDFFKINSDRKIERQIN